MLKCIYSPEYLRLTGWLRDQRKARKLNMRELAAELGVCHTTIGKIEKGEQRLDVFQYLQYCKTLEISPFTGFRLMDPGAVYLIEEPDEVADEDDTE